jgi:L-ascorbate metabolism protein UlaG (beta-lactamase superfamily)
MRIRFVRHATFIFETNGHRMMVDPMLAAVEATGPVANTPNQRRNPLVDLPFGAEGTLALLGETDAVLLTHLHNDHWDGRARDLIPRQTPILRFPAGYAGRRRSAVERLGPHPYGRTARY